MGYVEKSYRPYRRYPREVLDSVARQLHREGFVGAMYWVRQHDVVLIVEALAEVRAWRASGGRVRNVSGLVRHLVGLAEAADMEGDDVEG